MDKHDYSEASTNELLDWVKQCLDEKDYPEGTYKLNKCLTILNVKDYLTIMLRRIKYDRKHPEVQPLIKQLWEYKESWEKQKNNYGQETKAGTSEETI